MGRMSPNQSGTTTKLASESDQSSSTVNPQTEPQSTPAHKTTNHHPNVVVDVDPLLSTDCPSYSDAVRYLIAPRISGFLSPPQRKVDENEGGGSESSSQNITIESIKGHSDEEEEDFDDDDRSSVVTESSCSEYGDQRDGGGRYHEGLKSTANSLAIEAINCASDELQTSKSGVICVNSELRASTAGSLNGGSEQLAARAGQQNNGYVMSEIARPRSSRNGIAGSGKELALNGQHTQIVPSATNSVAHQSSVSSATSPSGQTTAIFNDSTDITLGNKTFITGSLTIKQYIKDTSANNQSAITSGPEQSRWKKLSTTKKFGLIAGMLVLILGFIAATVVLTVMPGQSNNRLSDGDDNRYNIPINSTIDDDLSSAGSVLRFITRSEWIAQPPNAELADLVLPVKRIIIAHTATENCTTQSKCVFQVRQIQTYHMESRSFDDIGYNFLVGGDGAAYEGRGWNKQGAHTKGYNKGTICIAFIGTFNKYEPPLRQLNVAKLLLEEGVRLNKLDKDYKLYGHRQFFGTESPGEALYKIITKWDHWADDVI